MLFWNNSINCRENFSGTTFKLRLTKYFIHLKVSERKNGLKILAECIFKIGASQKLTFSCTKQCTTSCLKTGFDIEIEQLNVNPHVQTQKEMPIQKSNMKFTY